MQEEKQQARGDRRKRVQTLKKMIITMLMLSIATPCILCIVLFVRLNCLTNNIDELKAQLASVTEKSKKQEEELSKLMDMLAQKGSGEMVEVSAAKPETENVYDVTEETKDSIKANNHKVYLTFDDGPSIYTEEILDILDRYQVKATFFVVGKDNDIAKEALRRIVEDGHTLGMHSYSHKYQEIYESEEAFSEDFWKLRDYLYDVTGVESNIYRFPGGSSNTVSNIDMSIFANYLEGQDVVFFDWNIASGDGGSELLDVDTLVNNSTKEIVNWESAIVLLHDSGDKRTTVEALPIIIENILALEDTVILPITEETVPVQHIKSN